VKKTLYVRFEDEQENDRTKTSWNSYSALIDFATSNVFFALILLSPYDFETKFESIVLTFAIFRLNVLSF